ncbi:MAG: TM1266 family iron-only hydrogenase system putative regulator [Clostridium sp.]|uniref:TM1266 family iron-only hydrogenase system putative regulator n=1 Tax=Clostridium sp. TaxID=1506 RepID=UPI003F38A823
MKVAVVSIILENPIESQEVVNKTLSFFRGQIKGRMGIPLEEGISIISVILKGEIDMINSLTGKLGNIKGVTVKTAIGKKEV